MSIDIKAQKATTSIRNQTLDQMKLVLSVFVVMIHAEVRIGWLQPFLRTAVPLFFITSGWFFFQKSETCQTKQERQAVLRRFLKRNLLLYGFWFAVLLPVTVHAREWFSGSLTEGLLRFAQSLFFNSTFRASWYIMALCIGMSLSLWLARRMRPGTQLLVTLPVYLLCCLFSNYYGFAARWDGLMEAYHGYIRVFRSLCNSFPVSLFWLALGRYFARERRRFGKKRLAVWTLASAAALVGEYLLICRYGSANSDDAYLMLVPLCAGVFLLARDAQWKGRAGFPPASVSTVIYAAHASVITVVGGVLRRLTGVWPGENWVIFAVSLGICLIIHRTVRALEKRTGLRWLRYAY